jgi:hypothetical protein
VYSEIARLKSLLFIKKLISMLYLTVRKKDYEEFIFIDRDGFDP